MEGSTVRSRPEMRDRTVLAQLTSFAAIGGLTTCVDFILFNLLMDVFPVMPANMCGYLMGTFVAWVLNTRYTFGLASRRLDFGFFLAVNMAGLALTTAAVQVTVLGAPGDLFLLNLTKLCAGGGIMLLRFVVLRTWTAGLWRLPLADQVGRSSNAQSR
jgi:putative flippase GtrA